MGTPPLGPLKLGRSCSGSWKAKPHVTSSRSGPRPRLQPPFLFRHLSPRPGQELDMHEAILTVGQCCLHLQQGGHLGTGQHYLPSVQHPVQSEVPQGGEAGGRDPVQTSLGWDPIPEGSQGNGMDATAQAWPWNRGGSWVGYPWEGVLEGRGGCSEASSQRPRSGFGPRAAGDVQEGGLGVRDPQVVCPRLGSWATTCTDRPGTGSEGRLPAGLP